MAKYIFVAGGVMSGIGKGVTTASIGKVLKSKGFRVTAMKIDPYVNVDAGTMDLLIHGEAFLNKDGDQCDQDMGNYERFLDEELTRDNYMTTGRVYQSVINRERNLGYKGRCVEVVPDIPNEAIFRIKRAAKKTKAEFVLIEIGGTVGEYQNILFLEAARLMRLQQPKDVLFALVSYLPIPSIIGEMKTKPTQTAVRTLNATGIQPDIILARSVLPLDNAHKRKLSIFCNVAKEDVISAPDIKSIYEVPINFEKENLGDRILRKFDLKPRKNNLKDWKKLIGIIKKVKKPVKIGIVERYFKSDVTALTDSYLSMTEAIKHASWFCKRKPEIYWLDSKDYEKDGKIKELKKYDGIIVTGGFGDRGIKGKIKAIEFCRKNKIPFLGLGFGMRLAVIEFIGNVCGIKKADSVIIDGETMRLGEYKCKIKPKTLSSRAYKAATVFERHRHCYELNNDFREKLEEKGMVMAGVNPEKDLVEIIEIPKHPFFVGTQFHPEFKSRPLRPHPLFREFIKASVKQR